MINDFKVFLLSETNTKNLLEFAGNICLLPARTLWNGHSIKIGHVLNFNSLEMHYKYRKNEIHSPCGNLLRIMVLIVTIIPGILLKGLAYLSSSVRARHAVIIESLNPNPQFPKGLSLVKDESRFTKAKFTIKFDFSENKERDIETFIGKKILEFKPHLSLKRGCYLDLGDHKYEDLDQKKTIMSGSEEIPLSTIFVSRCFMNKAIGRGLDPETLNTICIINDDYLVADIFGY